MTYLPQDSALNRARDPDGWFWTVEAQLFAEIATAVHDLRYFTALRTIQEPDDYLPMRFGPKVEAPQAESAGRSTSDVQADADLLRSEMGLVA